MLWPTEAQDAIYFIMLRSIIRYLVLRMNIDIFSRCYYWQFARLDLDDAA